MSSSRQEKVSHTNERFDEGPPITQSKPTIPRAKSTLRKRGPKAKGGLGEDGAVPMKSSPKKKHKVETSESDDEREDSNIESEEEQ